MAPLDDAAVRLDDVGVRFGGEQVLADVSLACHASEWTVITGPSGVGKSTLLRVVNGLCAPERGRVTVLGTRIPGRSRREAREAWRRTGTVLQDVAIFETVSVRANVEVALRAVGEGRRAARRTAAEWLERLGLADKLDAHPADLSGGQSQRVALARAMARRPALLLLDEPTSALDRDTARIVFAAIRELADQGSTVLMSTHREDEVLTLCDRRVVLVGGRLVEVPRDRRRLARIAHVAVRVTDGPGRSGGA